jgi:hypothetical protein
MAARITRTTGPRFTAEERDQITDWYIENDPF